MVEAWRQLALTNTQTHGLQRRPTLFLHGSLGVPHGLPGAGDVQEDSVCHPAHSKPVFAHVLVPDGHQMIHPVLLELFGCLLGPLLVELYRVQVTRGGDGAQYSVGEGTAARPYDANSTGRMRAATTYILWIL